jgi:Ca-activated chloride channel family protein
VEAQPIVTAISSVFVATSAVATLLIALIRARPKLRVRIRGPDHEGRLEGIVTNVGWYGVLIEACGFDVGDQRISGTGIPLPRKIEANDFCSFSIELGHPKARQSRAAVQVRGAWVRTAQGREFHSRERPKRPPSPLKGLLAGLGRAVTTVYAVALVVWLVSLPPAAAPVSLIVVASNEKASLLSYLAKQFNERPTLDFRQRVRVEVHRIPSGEAAEALKFDWNLDEPRPDVWTPAAKSWPMLLRQERLTAGREDIIPADIPTIAASPLVVAMPRPIGRSLGWPERKMTWREIFDLVTAPGPWPTRDSRQWGSFRLWTTRATVSTSGLHTLIAQYSVATGGWNLSCADLTRPEVIARVRPIQEKLAGTERTVRDFLERLYEIDQKSPDPERAVTAHVSAFPMEEAQMWQYNKGNPRFKWTDPAEDDPKRDPPKVPLVAFYPADGTLMADHPYVVLEAPWVTPEKKAAAQRFLEFLQGPEQKKDFLEAGFREELRLGEGRGEEDGLIVDPPPNPQETPTPELVKCIREARVG